MIALFFVPIIEGPLGPWELVRQPKYVEALAPGRRWSMMEYGWEDLALVAIDATAPEIAAIEAKADALKLPDDLDQAIGAGALTTVRQRLRQRNIPASWISSATTWREALRVTLAIFLLLQSLKKHTVSTVKLFSQISLDTTWGTIPEVWRGRILEGLALLGANSGAIQDADTIEEILQIALLAAKDREIAIGILRI